MYTSTNNDNVRTCKTHKNQGYCTFSDNNIHPTVTLAINILVHYLHSHYTKCCGGTPHPYLGGPGTEYQP
jgi:hypothetical protein